MDIETVEIGTMAVSYLVNAYLQESVADREDTKSTHFMLVLTNSCLNLASLIME